MKSVPNCFGVWHPPWTWNCNCPQLPQSLLSSLCMSINMLYIYVSIDTFICYATLTYHLCHIGNISCAVSHQTQSSSLCHLGNFILGELHKLISSCHIGILFIFFIVPHWHICMSHRQILYFCLIGIFIVYVPSDIFILIRELNWGLWH